MSSTTSNVIRHNDLVSRLRHASYATRSADQDTTHQSVTSEDAKQRTICFLVELVGFSISADTKQLASARNAYTSADLETPSSTSVLSAEDRERLHDLSLLAKRVHEKVLTKRHQYHNPIRTIHPLPKHHPVRRSSQRQRHIRSQLYLKVHSPQMRLIEAQTHST